MTGQLFFWTVRSQKLYYIVHFWLFYYKGICSSTGEKTSRSFEDKRFASRSLKCLNLENEEKKVIFSSFCNSTALIGPVLL